jgi:magnesium and cobalt transporter
MSFLTKKLKSFFQPKEDDLESFFNLLNSEEWSEFVGQDEIRMIRGVFEVSELQVRDIMIPRSSMTVLDRDASITDLLYQIGNSGHSRFPVIGENKDEVVGILLAKDLLKYSSQSDNSDFEIKDFLRSPTFIPESKRLKILLNEFRKSRNHMAIVVDEYGRIAGLLTIEDVLEQIVGDIEDEFDAEDLPMIREKGKGRYEVDALIRIEDFNEFFDTQYLDEDFDTLGGMIINKLGKFPQIGESLMINLLTFKVLRSDSRRLQLIEVREIE